MVTRNAAHGRGTDSAATSDVVSGEGELSGVMVVMRAVEAGTALMLVDEKGPPFLGVPILKPFTVNRCVSVVFTPRLRWYYLYMKHMDLAFLHVSLVMISFSLVGPACCCV